jgi:hypothetical protein
MHCINGYNGHGFILDNIYVEEFEIFIGNAKCFKLAVLIKLFML